MATDDLNTPLGLNRPPARFRVSRLAMPLVAGFLGAILVTFLGWGLFGNDPFGGEPMTVTQISQQTAPHVVSGPAAHQVAAPGPNAAGWPPVMTVRPKDP